MKDFFSTHPKTKWCAIAVGTLLLVLVLFLVFFDWNVLRPLIAKQITAKTGRPAAISGDLKVHLWSLTPSAELYGLSIDNPPWADRHLMFGAQRIAVSISLLRLLRGQIVLPQIELDSPVVNLQRDDHERASWELGTPSGTPNHDTSPSKLPAIRSLVVREGKLHLVDQVRKLKFDGSLAAADRSGHDDAAAFKVHAKGTLNAKPFILEANGGPLLDLSPDKPYSFAAHLAASDINLDTHVTVEKPFDLSRLGVKLVVSGNDLADVYYLTGLALPNTPKYRLAATVQVDGTKYHIQDLKGSLGSSDIAGQIDVANTGKRPKLSAKLTSVNLNIADLAPTLGQPAAAAASEPGLSAPKAANAERPTKSPNTYDRLLPDADLQINRVRGMDADVTYHASSVTAPKVPMKQVGFHLLLDNGLLTIDPLSFVLDSGRFSGSVKIDARREIPQSSIDMRIDAVDLGQFKSASMKQAPLQGSLVGRVRFHGAGSSIHKLAADADGGMSIVIPHGQVSDTIAELTGINVLRGLGLLISKDQDLTEIRCGIVDFQAQDGKLVAKSVYIDTSNVLITGRGNIDLESEALDLSLQGDPKKIRLLRLRSPIALGGTLSHPAVGIKPEKLALQAGVATALGVLLTPAAAAMAFIDPGLAKNKDCSGIMAQASQPL